MSVNVRKTTTAYSVKEKYTEVREAARRLQQLAKEVCITLFTRDQIQTHSLQDASLNVLQKLPNPPHF